jgi:hypothetical protein
MGRVSWIRTKPTNDSVGMAVLGETRPGSERAKRDEICWSDRFCANSSFPRSLFSKAPFRFRPDRVVE